MESVNISKKCIIRRNDSVIVGKVLRFELKTGLIPSYTLLHFEENRAETGFVMLYKTIIWSKDP